jgi:hypothetical protein
MSRIGDVVVLALVAGIMASCASQGGAPSGVETPTATVHVTASPRPTPPPTPSPSPEPTLPDWINRTPSPECITPPPDLMTVIFTADPVACYGQTPLALEGVVDPIGTYDPILLTEPAWLGMPYWTLHAIVEGARAEPVALAMHRGEVARPTTWPTPDLWIVADPASGIDLADYAMRAVSVVGHFDDPAAATCHFTEDYSSLGFEAEDAVRSCRAQFVVTEIGLLGT